MPPECAFFVYIIYIYTKNGHFGLNFELKINRSPKWHFDLQEWISRECGETRGSRCPLTTLHHSELLSRAPEIASTTACHNPCPLGHGLWQAPGILDCHKVFSEDAIFEKKLFRKTPYLKKNPYVPTLFSLSDAAERPFFFRKWKKPLMS